MLFFIKYFSLILCAFYSFNKITNHFVSKIQRVTFVLINFVMTVIASLINFYNSYCAVFLIIVFSFFLIIWLLRVSEEIAINAVIISYGVSHITFTLSAFIVGICTQILSSYSTYNHLYAQLITTLFQLILTILFFMPKRLRKGIPVLLNKISSSTILSISLIILYISLILSNISGNSPVFITLYFITFVSAICLYINWRNSITRTYNDKRRDRDIDILTEHIDELEEEYKKLAEDKDELAKIVHRDNKLVPAMLLSVESFLTEFSDATPEMKSRGQELMAELNKEAERRKGILKQQDQKCTAKLISTGIPYLDSVLTYMQEKAMSKDIVLSASGDPGIADLAARTIEEEDLKTLAADMLENAIIANTHNHGSNIYFVIGYFGKHMAIYVYDSGIPFTKEVLLDLGIQKHTTHEADGGSGIGLMTIFELVRKYRATYIIDEYSTPTGPYTKRITIVFDKRRKYILNTSRPKEEIDFLRQRADLIIEARKEPHINHDHRLSRWFALPL